MNSAETEKKSEPANAMGAARFLLFLVLVVVTTWLFLPVSLLGFICLCSFIVLVIKEEVRYRAEERSRMDDAERSRVNKKRTCEEGESLRWLNEGMKRIWPMSTEFASTYFFGPMASTFLDKYKPRGSGLVEDVESAREREDACASKRCAGLFAYAVSLPSNCDVFQSS